MNTTPMRMTTTPRSWVIQEPLNLIHRDLGENDAGQNEDSCESQDKQADAGAMRPRFWSARSAPESPVT